MVFASESKRGRHASYVLFQRFGEGERDVSGLVAAKRDARRDLEIYKVSRN